MQKETVLRTVRSTPTITSRLIELNHKINNYLVKLCDTSNKFRPLGRLII